MRYLTAIRKHTMTVGEDFPSSGQVRPSAAAAGPVRSSLRCGRPARRRRTTKSPMTEHETPQIAGPVLSDQLLTCVRAGRRSPPRAASADDQLPVVLRRPRHQSALSAI
jgi:hypothetical protein